LNGFSGGLLSVKGLSSLKPSSRKFTHRTFVSKFHHILTVLGAEFFQCCGTLACVTFKLG
jgi:hypothetical protein